MLIWACLCVYVAILNQTNNNRSSKWNLPYVVLSFSFLCEHCFKYVKSLMTILNFFYFHDILLTPTLSTSGSKASIMKFHPLRLSSLVRDSRIMGLWITYSNALLIRSHTVDWLYIYIFYTFSKDIGLPTKSRWELRITFAII